MEKDTLTYQIGTKMSTNREDAVINAAVESLLYHIKRTRRRVLVSRIGAWLSISTLVGFAAFFVFSNSSRSDLVLFLLAVAGFGIYQAVRVLRIAAGQALAIEVFQESLREAYEKLAK